MSSLSGKDVDRRGFFHTILRGAALGALGGATWFLFSKQCSDSMFQCANDKNCRDCLHCRHCPASHHSSPERAHNEEQTLRG